MISYLHSCSPLVITCGRCRLSSIMVLSSSEIHTQIQVQLHTLIYKSGGCDLIYKGNGALCDRWQHVGDTGIIHKVAPALLTYTYSVFYTNQSSRVHP